MIISIDVEKVFDTINILLWWKKKKKNETLNKGGIEGTYLSTIKAISDKCTDDILKGEKLKAFPLRSGRRQGWPPSPLLFNIVLKVLVTAIRQEKEKKEFILERKKGNCCCLQMTWYYIKKIIKMILQKLLELINELSCRI